MAACRARKTLGSGGIDNVSPGGTSLGLPASPARGQRLAICDYLGGSKRYLGGGDRPPPIGRKSAMQLLSSRTGRQHGLKTAGAQNLTGRPHAIPA
ncbi:hypothetical protein GCM10010228_77770 [Streptomyces massasporeus]|nr:hypothetical protein GCM10010228_77770 [Streptomyces massasporeus]